MKVKCHCGAMFDCTPGRWNRAASIGAPLYCSRACSHEARRCPSPPSEAERKAAKADYDRLYRERNRGNIKARKADYFRRTYDPQAAAVERKKRMPRHVEYCRQPAYRQKKAKYDLSRRAQEFGPFSDAWMLLRGLQSEIDAQASRYEIYQTNGTLNKAQSRRRAL